MEHDRLPIKEVAPDMEVRYVLTPDQKNRLEELLGSAEEIRDLHRKLERAEKRIEATRTLFWDDLYDELDDEEADEGAYSICARGDEYVIVDKGDMDDDDGCDCPLCSMKRAGVPPKWIAAFRRYFGDGDH